MKSVSSTCTSGIVSTALILYLWVLLNRCHHRLSVKNKKKYILIVYLFTENEFIAILLLYVLYSAMKFQ